MTEHVFGLTVNEVMAYAAIANVVLVLLLAPVGPVLKNLLTLRSLTRVKPRH